MGRLRYRHLYHQGANAACNGVSGCCLSGANLTGVDLTNANLNGANLYNVVLTNAVLTNAILTGVGWNNTICPDGINSNFHMDGSCMMQVDQDRDGVPDDVDSEPLNAAITTEKVFAKNGTYKGSSVKEMTNRSR